MGDTERDSDQAGALDRAVRFLRGFARRRAREILEVPEGFVVLDREYPASYDHNKLVVTGRPDPRDILAAADAGIGGAGMDHRMVVVEDDQHGRECAPIMEAGGFRHDVNLIMSWNGAESECPVGTAHDAATRLHPAELVRPDRRRWRAYLPSAGERTIRDLVERRDTLGRGASEVTFLGVRDRSGAVVSHADLYLDGGTAQIEDLSTDPDHAQRGHARAVLLAALARANAAACDLVFLVADADDWPRSWYQRLGFQTIGAYHVFVRPAAST
jgi:ribosomal protein S18 acetylase RimI-like enzyme